MKKLGICMAIMIMLFSYTALADTTVYEKPDIQIVVGGERLAVSDVPIIVNNRTLIPLRELLVGLGVPDNDQAIQWNGNTKSVKVIYNGITIDLSIGSTDAYINSSKSVLDSAPIIHKSRTYLPARFVGEALGYTITWDQYTPAVIVTPADHTNKLKEIINNMKYATNSVRTYEVSTVKKSNMTILNNTGNNQIVSSTTSSIQKGDLFKNILYTEIQYKDDAEHNINLEYTTQDKAYFCYKYEEGGQIYSEEWNTYDYNPEYDEATPYEEKEKWGIINWNEDIAGDLMFREEDDCYVIFNPTNKPEILNYMQDLGVFEQAMFELSDINEFNMNFVVDKNTYLPIRANMKLKTSLRQEADENMSGIEINDDISYDIVFKEYNGSFNLLLPTV